MHEYSVMAVRSPFQPASVDEIHRLHRECFPDREVWWPGPDGTVWFLVFNKAEPAAFCALSPRPDGTGWMSRAGVLPRFRGQGLQARMISHREVVAQAHGFATVVTNINRDNPHSMNNFIDAGYRPFWPAEPWDDERATYWRKVLN
jgi:GNAT superfamily N-acetyltransferase